MTDTPDLTVANGEWKAPLNRVAILIDENGEFQGMVADIEIEFFVVQPSCERDRVYQYSSGQFGPQYVQAAFDNHPVGHADDDMLKGGTNYGKLAPSKPKLSLVPQPPENQP